jgi:TRAP-type C4-dicarboxylate transport system substrate-binding protein
MTDRKTRASCLTFLTGALMLTACGGDSGGTAKGEKSVVIDYATFKAPGNLQCADDAERFADLVDEKTNGSVKIKIHFSDSLVPQAELVDALSTRTVDAGCVFATFFPAQLSMWNELGTVHDMDLSTSVDPHAQNRITRAAMNEFPDMLDQVEKLGVHLVYSAASGPHAMMSKFPVDSTDDIDGRKIRTYGTGIPLLIEEVGGVPVDLPWTETYTALQAGTVEGALTALNALEEAKLDEVAPHLTVFGDHGSTPLMAPGLLTVINQSVWDGLSKSQQKAIMEAGEETEAWLADEQVARAESSIETMIGRSDVTRTDLTGDSLADLQKAAEKAFSAAAAALEEQGLPGEKFVARVREIAAEEID